MDIVWNHTLLLFLLAVTGNSNFNMNRTTLSFIGMTQPFAAMPVVQDQSNNAKGFTSRIFCSFPEPVFAKFEDTMLSTEGKDVDLHLRKNKVQIIIFDIVNILVYNSNHLYINRRVREHRKHAEHCGFLNTVCDT